MSRENVELWRAGIEHFRAGKTEFDWEGWLDREAAESLDPEIEWDGSSRPCQMRIILTGPEGGLRLASSRVMQQPGVDPARPSSRRSMTA
jgi:hypothetical protein